VWLLFAANFSYGFLWGGDAQVPYTFLRRLFGGNVDASGYQFGLAFFEAPFYAVGRGLEAIGVATIRTHPTDQFVIAVGTALYMAVAVWLVYWLLTRLGMRFPAVAAAITLFGSPVFFFAVFSPGQTHVVDSLLATGLVLVTFVGFEGGWHPRLALLAGVLVGVAMTLRPLEAALGAGLLVGLVIFRRRAAALFVAVGAAASYLALVAVPLALGAPLFGHTQPTNVLRWSPASPVHMLFSIQRGLFIWTPATALAVVGYVVYLRANPQRRPFLATGCLMALALVSVQALVPFWTAGWSFSQRYLIGLFPLIAIGIGGLFQVRWRITLTLCSACVAWSMFLALAMVTLPFDQNGGVNDLIRLARQQSVGSFAYGVWYISHFKILVPGNPFGARTVPAGHFHAAEGAPQRGFPGIGGADDLDHATYTLNRRLRWPIRSATSTDGARFAAGSFRVFLRCFSRSSARSRSRPFQVRRDALEFTSLLAAEQPPCPRDSDFLFVDGYHSYDSVHSYGTEV
jgi:hypothetical protein